MRRHKVLSAIGIFFLIGSCSALVPTPPEDGPAVVNAPLPEPTVEAVEEPESPPSDPVEEPEPTAEEIWLSNYVDDEESYTAAVLTALGVRKVVGLSAEVPLASCGLLAKAKPVGARTSKAAVALGLRKDPSVDEVFLAITAATTYVCPDYADLHQSQISEFKKSERVAARAAARKQARQQRRDEARQRREDRAAAAAAAAQPPAPAPAPAHYANCSEVEAAGAAPIYAGEPGYSSSLDRDGDGVACEQ